MTDLLTRLLALAELAVDEALQFEYGDPEDRHIWRELQKLKPLVAAALAQPEPEEPTDEDAVAVYSVVMALHDCQTLGDMAGNFARAVLARYGRNHG